jgi:tetratricopeptide (TPR) repeat protein
MASGQYWGQIIGRHEGERFVGRDRELQLFAEELQREPPRTLVFYLTGQAGVGKTTLLRRYQLLAQERGFLLAECDERQRDVLAVLGHFAAQLEQQGVRLKSFEERHRLYYQLLHEIEADPQAPRGPEGFSIDVLLRIALVAGELLPVVGPVISYLPREELEELAREWGRYLLRKLGDREAIALLREPEEVLSPLFFADLNRATAKRAVLLCFDNLEVTRPALFPWLLRLPGYQPSWRIRLVLAGRESLTTAWGALSEVTQIVHLDVFSEEEAQAFLDAYHVSNPLRRREIIEVSGRLPVLMSWLAAPREAGVTAAPELPVGSIVERFLRWVNDPLLRETALLGALPRLLNRDVLACLWRFVSGSGGPAPHMERAFDWLVSMPFVVERGEGWGYHPLVRRMMLEYLRRRGPSEYCALHAALATFYRQQRDALYAPNRYYWRAPRWQEGTLNYLYHALIADARSHWGELLELLIFALSFERRFASRLIELTGLEEVRRELEGQQQELSRSLKELLAREGGGRETELALFEQLCQEEALSPRARAAAYRYRARTRRYLGWYAEALDDLNQAVALDGQNARAFIERALVLRQLGNYEEALADFSRALALRPRDARTLASRGRVYVQLGRYAEALQDFNSALALDDGYSWALVRRAGVYRLLGEYEKALQDLDRVAALNAMEVRAWRERGEVCRALGRYDEALECFTRTLELQPDDPWGLAGRGQVYLALERHQEALVDLRRALSLDASLVEVRSACEELERRLTAPRELPALEAGRPSVVDAAGPLLSLDLPGGALQPAADASEAPAGEASDALS